MKVLLLAGFVVVVPLSTGTSMAGILDAFLPPDVADAQNRCLMYGFKNENRLARCTETELKYDQPKSWKLGDVFKAQGSCEVLGYNGDKLAACVQRNLRQLP